MVATSAFILQDAASQAPLTVEAGKPEDLAANPIEWMATAPPQHNEETEDSIPEWSVAETKAADDLDSSETQNVQSAPELVVPKFSAPAVPVPSITSSTPPTPPAPPPAPPRAAQPAQPQAKTAAEGSDPVKTQPSVKPFSQSAEDTARSILKEDWADLAATLQTKAPEPIAEKAKPAPGNIAQVPPPSASNGQPEQANSAAGAPPDPALVETVVQRILDKMSPQVVDLITKEFLRPIVQALVHREIEKH